MRGVIGLNEGDFRIQRTLFFGIIGVFFFSLTAYGDLTAHWPLNGDANDISGNNWHGTVYGAKWSPEGLMEGALELDGAEDYVEIVGYKAIGGGASRTCCAWIKTADKSSWNDVIGWGNMEPGRRWLLTITPEGYVQLAAYDGYRRGTSRVNDGRWHHVAAVLENDGSPDTSEIKIYIDGTEESSYVTQARPIDTGSQANVQIGLYNFNDASGRYFQGLIDDVRIYDLALTDEDILQLGARFAGGNGTVDNPYQISTPEQLLLIGSKSILLSKHFVLMNDINMLDDPSNNIFMDSLIAPEMQNTSGFKGSFDGKDHVIHNLVIASDLGSNYVGLFGIIGNTGTVRNLGIVNATFDVWYGSWYQHIGLLAGRNSGTIRNCYVTGLIDGEYVGGLCGYNDSGLIEHCHARVFLIGYRCGGLICDNDYGTISDCYAEGSLISSAIYNRGGLIGYNDNGMVRNCYSSFRGYGLIGSTYNSTVISSFWDKDISGQAASAAGTGKSTPEMKDINTFLNAGWDFSEADGNPAVWKMPVNDYPRLSGEIIKSKYSGGLGTERNPYQISTPQDWQELAQGIFDWNADFILKADLDLSGVSLTPIGNKKIPFTGTFNGNNHYISNATITMPGSDYVGLFGFVNEGEIKQLGVYNVTVVGDEYVGGLAGAQFFSRMVSCSSRGLVTGNSCVGGLIGLNGPEISLPTGSLPCPGYIAGCYASGIVTGGTSVGGLAGVNDDSYIYRCFATAKVSGNSNIGGLMGRDTSSTYYGIEGSFWDTNVSGITDGVGNLHPDPVGAQGKTTIQMQTLTTFTAAGWDFSETDGSPAFWKMLPNDYPRLAWERTINYAGSAEIALALQEKGFFRVDLYSPVPEPRTWTIEGQESCGWITQVNPRLGSSSGPADVTTVTISVDTEGLNAGDYVFSLTIVADNGDHIPLSVLLHVYNQLDLEDLLNVAQFWLETDCDYTQACSLADLAIDGTINLADLAVLTKYWLHTLPMAAHWPLDEDAQDAGGSHLDGIVHGGAIFANTEGWNGSIELDGVEDYVEIPGFTGFGGGVSRTCCAWIKTADKSSWNDVIGWGNMEPGRRWLVTITPEGYVKAAVVDGYQQGTTAVNDGSWHHIAVILRDDGTANTNEVEIYIDGRKEINYSTLARSIDTGLQANVQIGLYNFNDASGRYFQGLIDDVRIYSRALDSTEIQSLMAGKN